MYSRQLTMKELARFMKKLLTKLKYLSNATTNPLHVPRIPLNDRVMTFTLVRDWTQLFSSFDGPSFTATYRQNNHGSTLPVTLYWNLRTNHTRCQIWCFLSQVTLWLRYHLSPIRPWNTDLNFYENVYQFWFLKFVRTTLYKFIFIDDMQQIRHLSIQLWKKTKHFNHRNWIK